MLRDRLLFLRRQDFSQTNECNGGPPGAYVAIPFAMSPELDLRSGLNEYVVLHGSSRNSQTAVCCHWSITYEAEGSATVSPVSAVVRRAGDEFEVRVTCDAGAAFPLTAEFALDWWTGAGVEVSTADLLGGPFDSEARNMMKECLERDRKRQQEADERGPPYLPVGSVHWPPAAETHAVKPAESEPWIGKLVIRSVAESRVPLKLNFPPFVYTPPRGAPKLTRALAYAAMAGKSGYSFAGGITGVREEKGRVPSPEEALKMTWPAKLDEPSLRGPSYPILFRITDASGKVLAERMLQNREDWRDKVEHFVTLLPK